LGVKALLIFLLTFIYTLFYPTLIASQIDPALEWHLLYVKIRDRLVTKEEALGKLREWEVLPKDFYFKNGDKEFDDRLCFPLKGYHSHAIGGKRGSGYQVQDYDFFDGNGHRGHPGHDIFIRDKNQDGLDDVTGRPVEVLSASPGIVVSVNADWKPITPIRGGNYIWIYEPVRARYYYYAHLNEIFITVGQKVSRGDRLGTVGRTGAKAYLGGSPTHLHFVVHRSIKGYPKPVNPYMELVRSIRE
jgi:murein DD-endopeptidase MepM/ murein hydrolase activator NlpD